MTTTRARAAAVLLAVLVTGPVLGGCSFRGSVTGENAASSARGSGTRASTGPSGSSSPASGTTSRSSASGEPTTAPAGGTTGSAGAPDRCHTGELTGSLVAGSPGAGQRYATLVLRNTGGRPCTVHGYGGLGLVGADGRALPTHQVRAPSPAPGTVLLSPGGTVSSQLHWSVVTGPGDATSGACQPSPATLRVIPPDETDALQIRWDQGPVCSGGSIEQKAYAG